MDLPLSPHVQRTRGFVEYIHARAPDGSASDRNALPLSTRELHASLPNRRSIPLRQTADELMEARSLGCLLNFLQGASGTAKPDIISNRLAEQNGLLRNDSDAATNDVVRKTVEAHSTEKDLAAIRLQEFQK